MRLLLAIEPRPASTWGITLANRLPWKDWDDIRQKVLWDAQYECEICGAKGKLHVHEIWKFDDKKKIQRLVRVEARCTLCHDVHHFGRSTQVYSKAYQNQLIQHWCKINKKARTDFDAHLAEIRLINKKRANIFYIVKVGRKTLT